MNPKTLIFSSVAFLVGVIALGTTIWNCYRGIYLSELTSTPLFLFIAVPAGILLLITWRKEIRNWTLIPSIILAACVGLTICDLWSAFPDSYNSWNEFSFELLLFQLVRLALISLPVFVFYGTQKFLDSLFSKFNNRKPAEQGAAANP
jgi:hypothetical protein